MNLPIPGAHGEAARPAVRAHLAERAQSPEAGVFLRLTDWGKYQIGDTYSAANEGLKGRVVGDIARERGQDPFDTLARHRAWPTTCARSCGRSRPTTTRRAGRCAPTRGTTPTS